MNIYLVIFLTLVAAVFTSYSQLLFKKSLTKRLNSLKEIIGLLKNRNILAGLLGYIIGFLIYIEALSHSQLSIVYPTFASCFIFVTLISAYQLRERVSPLRVAGILLVFFGIVIVALTA